MACKQQQNKQMPHNWGKPAKSSLIIRAVLIGILAVTVTLQSGCLSDLIKISYQSDTTIIDPSFSEKTSEPETSGSTNNTTGSTAGTTTAVSTTATAEPQSFEQQVKALLLAGLDKRQRSISIDDAVKGRHIGESKIQDTIDQIFAIYQDLYNRHAEFFYLNGSINVSYVVTQGANNTLSSMIVKPQYLDATKNLSDAELNKLIGQVNSVVDKLVSQIRNKTKTPWQQMLMAHDYLVKNVKYDPKQDQQKNHVISALLNHVTLCQGYAQSFQLICQRLGYDVRMITGQAGGIGHAWNLVKLDGYFYHVDVTHDDPTPDGGPEQPVQHVHFMRSDSVMKTTHTWETADYPKCPKDGAQYYRQNKLTANNQTTLYKQVDQFLNSIDYYSPKTTLLEILYTGSDLPSQTTFEKAVKAKLRNVASGHSIYYLIDISKKIAIVEITPQE